MTRRALPSLVVISAFAILSAGCSGGRTKDSAASTVAYAIAVSQAPGRPSEIKGIEVVRIEIKSGVAYRSSMVSTTNGTTTTATVNGHPFEVVGNEIRIGPRRYGPLSVGDRVEIDADGVRINGTLGGPLP